MLYRYILLLVKIKDIILINKSLIKTLLVLKYKYFVKITKIEDKKKCWLLLNKKTILKTFFNNIELILVNYLGLKLLYPNIYKSIN